MGINKYDFNEKNILKFDSNEHEIAIATKKLQVFYGDNHALFDGDLEFERYKITSLIGASGSGKSTYLRSLNRMNDNVARVEGEIQYRGLNVNSKK